MRGEGPDRPLAETTAGFGNGYVATVAGLTGTMLAFAVTDTSRYDACAGWTVITTFDARTGLSLREVELPNCGADAPPRRWRSAITRDGVFAWLAADRLLVGGADGKPAELDRGAITGLRAEGDLILWSHAGEPRAADPP